MNRHPFPKPQKTITTRDKGSHPPPIHVNTTVLTKDLHEIITFSNMEIHIKFVFKRPTLLISNARNISIKSININHAINLPYIGF